MALPDLTGQNIQDTYQRILQVSGSGLIADGTGSLFTPLNATSASYAETASFALTTVSQFPFTGSADISGSLSVKGTSRTIYTTASIVYSGSNVTQVTQSFGTIQQITNIMYSGSFADGNPLSIAVTGSDGINKLYTLTYSARLVTQIIQS